MRPGQNKRMRGRNNNNGGNRKGPNPLTRSYESNGPDVKIRGTAQHIGEKYLQLARDAQTSGDPVAAESYLQHAEHYFRLIAAAQQAQFQAQNGYARPNGEQDGDDGEDDDDLVAPDRFALPSERMAPQPQPQPYPQQQPQQQPQPYAERQGNGGERQDNQDRGFRQEPRPEGQERPYRPDDQQRQDRPYRSDNQDRPYRQDRNGYEQRGYGDRGGDRPGQSNYERGDRNNFRGDRPDRNDRNNNRQRYGRDDYRENREFRDNNRDNRDPQYREQPRVNMPREPQPSDVRPQPAAAAIEGSAELPAFITAPVRTPAPVEPPNFEEPAAMPEPAGEGDVGSEAQAEPLALRPRRRRRRVASAGSFEDTAPSGETPTGEP